MTRRKTKRVWVGRVPMGAGAPISVQSMTKTDTRNVEATLRQIEELSLVGCEMVRLAVPEMAAVEALKVIRQRTDVPLVADIHFNHRLAIETLRAGVDKVRINPGNIGAAWKVREVAMAARDRGVPIRIGVNAGSLEVGRRPTPEAMVESALHEVEILAGQGFFDVVVSLKASSLQLMIEANRLLSTHVDCPIHLGVTEAGLPEPGSVRSAVGMGILLSEGIGDTIRVSLTGDPVREVKVGYEILRSLGLRQRGPVVISCPTCGRCKIDLVNLAKEVHRRVEGMKAVLSIAVMGCAVNGPGEAKEADVGVAGGRGQGLLFRRGEAIGSVPEDQLVDALMEEIQKMISERERAK